MEWTIDFETRSRVDVRKCGSSRYARDESTELLCMAYSNGQGGVKVWKKGDPPPQDLLDSIQKGALVEAHNASFERSIWKHVCHQRMGWPPIKDDQWRCSMAACCRLALPRSLEDAANALKLSVQKDKDGAVIMRRLCKPKKPTAKDPGEWDNSPHKFERLYAYCAQDVVTEMAISKAIPPLTPFELKVWQLDQKINDRGIQLDVPAITNALACVQALINQAGEDLCQLTDGAVSSPHHTAKLLAWLKSQNCDLPDLTKQTVSEWWSEDLPPKVGRALRIRQDTSKSSTAKLATMLERCDDDGRIRGNLIYHGASTGRFSGAGVQIQNFPRGSLSLSEIELVHRLLPTRDADTLKHLFGSPLEVISSALRSFLIAAPGHRLLVGDFAQIEARVAAWVADETELIEGFKAGQDVYKPMAAKIYGKPVAHVNKGERQLGKVAVLGCQYGLGAKGFQAAVKAMAGQTVDLHFAKKAIAAYRQSNPRIKQIWADLNTACIRTVQSGESHRVGMLRIKKGNKTLQIVLPSGRTLHYWYPELETVKAPWSEGYEGSVQLFDPDEAEANGIEILGANTDRGLDWFDCRIPKASVAFIKKNKLEYDVKEMQPQYLTQVKYFGVHSQLRKWISIRTYGGMLFENVVQAIARDFLVESMLRLDQAGYPIIGTVHDEVICEVKEGQGSLDEFTSLLAQVPTWGKGCPVDTEVFESYRYRK